MGGAEEAPAFSLPDELPGLRAKSVGDLLEGGELEVAVATFDEVEQHAAYTELQGKIDLDNPEASRMAMRFSPRFCRAFAFMVRA
ncbi:MAG: hypothetical protein ACLTKG_04410 [Collinsella intestinalis]